MSAPGKFDYSSGGLDRPLYRSNFAAQMERSSSFRESMEHPVPSHPNMLRTTSPIAQTDVTNFFQCLRFDPKVVAADHKSIRQGDFKRHVSIALGIQEDESPSGSLKGKLIPSPIPEEIKRFKAGLRENNVKARERVKIFNEASSVFNKFFPSVHTKKRSRPEGFSTDRLVSGPGLGKMGIQGQTLAGGFEPDQKLDERPKSGVPNKRTRTSMMDVRSNSIVRQSPVVDRDKEIMRVANNNNPVQCEDRTSIGIEGWEKSRMKKKRSSINVDCHPNSASKGVDGYRDLKQGIQQKSTGDSRSRLNGDSNMLRQSAGNGANGYGRSDNLSQQTSFVGHSPLPRVDSDHNSLYNEKRERSIGSDKERVNLRGVNKSNIHDEFNSSSLVANTKTNASVRGPRSGSGLPPKLSPGLHNTPSPIEWDISGCTNKPPTLSGVTHRKRMTSNRSSSPPVTQWASQRPQKISRVARRTNLVPIVSSKDEVPYSDNISDAGCSETGFGLHKRSPAASPQLKLKGESSFSPAALSESEESGPPEIKSKDKGKQSDEVDGKAAQNIPRVSIPALQSRKSNKPAAGEENGDGVRRQGRTGRGFSSTRSLNPMGVDKLKNVGTAKHLRSARPIFDKSESKVGRPPTRKLSDRKAYKRQRATATNAPTLDFHVGSDDGREELLAAVNSAVNFAHNFPNSFWKQMDRYFCYISDDHINFMKQQGEISSMDPPPVLTSSDFDSRVCPEEFATSRVDSKASPLYQRLLSALISEDSVGGNEDLQVNGFGTMHDHDDDSEFSVLNNMEFNGFKNNERLELDESEDDESAILFKGVNKSAHHCNGKFSDNSPIDIEYDKLGIDEKIYLEARSIGISLEPMPSISNVEDEGIADEIKKLEEAICKEGSKKKKMVDRLLKPAIEMKELQEKELDQIGYDKLIEMAYEKSKASRRHHNAGGKNSNNRISKQAASAFVRRTLERCHQFEKTGKSYFSEPEIKDMFIARLATAEDTLMDKECNPSTSTPMGSQPSSSLTRTGQNSENYASYVLPSENALLEQATGKEDTAWSNRVKKRELLLDDVGIGTQLSSSIKGKRSDRDRDGKGKASSRSGGTNKIGRPSLSNGKGERKTKAKPKQKTTQISPSVRVPEQPKPLLPKPNEANSEYNNLEALEETEPILDLSQLQIPDGLGDFDTQPGDISSWFNMDDEEDFDIMELGIPMDDLSGLNIKL
ncbi:PREDICTED: uncharacterized protein LOC104767146 isoform X3 [Camelina sativa]|uniref:Uncharacterized protein LOC104767146 isoform X3 n=1 Tax=Camelina sativa TaxID=90675 RepID=A0ABM0XQR9_CAMSA|nr:PREDICTED: uncharacterized protein LOC104767146 isoform X3 [Camelina sativa]